MQPEFPFLKAEPGRGADKTKMAKVGGKDASMDEHQGLRALRVALHQTEEVPHHRMEEHMPLWARWHH